MENEVEGDPVPVAGLSETVDVFVVWVLERGVGVRVGVFVGGLRLKVDVHEPVLIRVPVGVVLRDNERVPVHVFVGM